MRTIEEQDVQALGAGVSPLAEEQVQQQPQQTQRHVLNRTLGYQQGQENAAVLQKEKVLKVLTSLYLKLLFIYYLIKYLYDKLLRINA